jgi:CheY-like chemotaxis protein
LKIYIVEDSPIIAASLIQLVNKIGHDVVGLATSYEEAVIRLSQIEVDMVLSDIMLDGEKNGIDLGVYIKKYLHIPVIYQSSITDAHLKDQALLTDPVAYLTKPIGRADLINALLNVEHA